MSIEGIYVIFRVKKIKFETKMSKQILKFPEGFLWGAASSAYQTEGGSSNSDWWAWEHSSRRQEEVLAMGKKLEDYQSGEACDFYNRYDEDFGLAQHMDHNAIRIGVEWSRIQPAEGKFNYEVLDHYEKMLQSAKAHGLTVFLTLHHYTNPVWFAKKGAFLSSESINLFTNYVGVVAERLGQYVDFWLTINEPEVYASHSYLFGRYPPREKSILQTKKVINNLINCHNASAEVFKLKANKPVSMAYQLADWEPAGMLSHITYFLLEYLANEYILKRTIRHCDFIGVNYYTHHHVGLLGPRKQSVHGHETNDLGWGIHPEGIERVLLNLKKYKKPIYITENGIADAKDEKRERFIKDHLAYIYSAIEKGIDIRGYLHWALTDNFEWDQGFWPRFGLVEIDRNDLLRRKVRYSATKFAEICKNNYLEI